MNAARFFVAIMLVLSAVAAFAQDTAPISEEVCAAFLPAGDAGSAAFFVGLGDAFFEQRAFTRAITAYSCAIIRDNSYAPAFARRGFAHTAQRNDPQALADYTRALELDEGLIEGYINRGVLYTNQGNFGLAIDDFTLALVLDPDNVAALRNRAVVHAIEGNYEFALEDIEEALFLAPNDAGLYAARGAVYLALAVQNYSQFTALAGENIPVPGGGSSVTLDALNRATVTGEFGMWLALLIPAER